MTATAVAAAVLLCSLPTGRGEAIGRERERKNERRYLRERKKAYGSETQGEKCDRKE